MSADAALQRAHAYLEDARDPTLDTAARVEALDASRAALLDARRARAQADLLLPIFTDLCSAAAADPAYPVRCVVPQAVEDLCLREMRAFVPASTPFLVRALHDDHVLVAKRAVRALTALFRKLVGFVVSVGVSEDTFPEARLSAWLQMQTKAIAHIQAQDEGLRKAATKFAETVVLAFSYSGSAGSPDHFTLDYVLKKRSSSPLLDPTALEEEGVRCVKAVARLITASIEGQLTSVRPDGSSVLGLPPPSFMTAIAVLSNLVRRRRKILQFTLPPLLMVVAAITGSTRPPSTAFHSLTEGQQQSIITVLRFSILALRAYPHARAGRAGTDITLATNDLNTYEKDQETRRKERASAQAAQERIQKAEAAAAAATRDAQARVADPRAQPTPAQKRPQPADPAHPWPRPPPKDAFAIAQTLTRSMPHQEVVNFIMTRLLLNIPPPESVPGAVKVRPPPAPAAAHDEPSQKRQRKSRFGSKEGDQSSAAPPAPKKVVTVRKVAPPVVPVRFTSDTTERLVTLCCRRIMKREAQAVSSGAGPLRLQLLARLLTALARRDTKIARHFCEEACSFIAEGIDSNIELALAWLHSLLFAEEFADFRPPDEAAMRPEIAQPKIEPDSTHAAETPSTEITEGSQGTKAESLPEDIEAQDGPAKPEEEPQDSPSPEAKKEEDAIANGRPAPVEPASPERNGAMTDDAPTGHSELPSTTEVDGAGDEEVEEEEEEPEPVKIGVAYERTLCTLLDLLRQKPDSPGDAFSKVITQAPHLPESVLALLAELCKDPSRIKLGLQSLRDVIVERSGQDRRICLSLLLGYTADPDDVLRGPAIRLVANKIYVECGGDIPQLIEAHAVTALNRAAATLSSPPLAEEVDFLDRTSLLLTALCGQKHELLRVLAESYTKSPSEGRRVLLRRAKDLAAHVGMAAKPIVDLVSGRLSETDRGPQTETVSESGDDGDLALEVLRALLKKFGKPSEELVEAARVRYEMNGNTGFIVAVLPGLPKEALLRHLSAIVESSTPAAIATEENETISATNGTTAISKKTAGFKEVVNLIMSTRPPALSPAELLIELHKIEPSAAASTAIRACFELRAVYKQAAVAQAVQQLIEMTVTPDLFMRTVHLARILHPELEKYLTDTVMKRLIEKKVWTNNLVWEGFLRYCADVKEKSLKLLLSLPAPQLEEALEKQPVLTAVFKDLVSNPKNAKKIQTKHRRVISAAIKKSSKGRK